jgi:HAD superfamily hydrolase (TIGR01490 family)
VTLAIFDLDNTLLGGDSDKLWGQFLAEQGHVDGEIHVHKQTRYYQDYNAGRLDILEFLRFQLASLAQRDMHTLHQWRDQYLQEKIRPIMLPKAKALLERHRNRGHTLLIITATNRFLTEPIAKLLEVEYLIATEPEIIDGCYSGQVVGIPSFREGKVTRLLEWLDLYQQRLEGSWFYSDSHNDLPLLTRVTYPIAVDPDEILAAEASQRNWPIISLR